MPPTHHNHHHPPILLASSSPSKCPEGRILDLNQSTIQELSLTRWPASCYGDLLQSILTLSHLRRLELADWGQVNGRAIRLILESCPQLESLLLPMNTMTPEVTTFWELTSTVSTWKFEAEPASEWLDGGAGGGGGGTVGIQAFNGSSSSSLSLSSSSSSTAALLQQITQQQPLRTRIEQLCLDRSAISMDLVLNLASVCPDLKELSLEETYGLGFIEATSESEAEDEEEESSEASVFTQSDDESETDDNDQGHDAFNQSTDQEMEESAEYQQDDAEEMSNMSLTPNTPNLASLGDFQQPLSHNAIDATPVLNEDFFEEYEADGAEDNADAQGGVQGNDLLLFLDRLNATCPKIHSFNFNECSSDRLDDFFMVSLIFLWGTSELRSIKARNVGIGSPMFFRSLAHTCSSTLTCLDLSMDLSYGGGMGGGGNGGGGSGGASAGQLGASSMAPLTNQSNTMASEPKRVFDVMILFHTFSALVFLDLRGVTLRTRWITSKPWACTRLKTLRISVESSGKVHDRQIYGQLGRLTMLQELVLTRVVKMPAQEAPVLSPMSFTRSPAQTVRTPLSLAEPSNTMAHDPYPSLDLSLDAGLDDLGQLVLLQKLDIRELGRHCLMNAAELEWLTPRWPSLQILEGLQDLSLEEEAEEEEVEVMRLALFQHRRPTIKIDLEHGKSRRQRKARGQDRTQPNDGDAAYSNNIHDNNNNNGNNNNNNDIDDAAEPDRPGGRCSRELMYESLRPRGGRSPSPLRTWY
ncbi:hypothetical protein DFQ27_003032 [Actinomortierella ambigua]|uniref:Uncharacterized protein n=1 Tax=Actinomortierella ambigua TaxID=1343610 RepID=A0A9P6UCT9_9FUNG|nr:hypothetical protein DFQ27_003032 [Actinomortierella ambigua]